MTEALCPSCRRGRMQRRVAAQVCCWCGQIRTDAVYIVPFYTLPLGAIFRRPTDKLPGHWYQREGKRAVRRLDYRPDVVLLYGPMVPVLVVTLDGNVTFN